MSLKKKEKLFYNLSNNNDILEYLDKLSKIALYNLLSECFFYIALIGSNAKNPEHLMKMFE